MSHDETDFIDLSADRKISEFPAVTSFPSNTIVTLIADGVNYQMSLTDFQNAFSAVGTIASVGSGLPIYNAAGSVSQIRTLEAAPSLFAEQIEAGGIEISDGAPVTLTTSDTYTVVQDSENIFCTVGATAYDIELKSSAPVNSVVRIFSRQSGATIHVSSPDGSSIIYQGAFVVGVTGFDIDALRSITLRKLPGSNWTQESYDPA